MYRLSAVLAFDASKASFASIVLLRILSNKVLWVEARPHAT
jgi:hypothetical protein